MIRYVLENLERSPCSCGAIQPFFTIGCPDHRVAVLAAGEEDTPRGAILLENVELPEGLEFDQSLAEDYEAFLRGREEVRRGTRAN